MAVWRAAVGHHVPHRVSGRVSEPIHIETPGGVSGGGGGANAGSTALAPNAAPAGATDHTGGYSGWTSDGLPHASTVVASHTTVVPAITSSPCDAVQSSVKLAITAGTTCTIDVTLWSEIRPSGSECTTVTLKYPALHVSNSTKKWIGPPKTGCGGSSSSAWKTAKSDCRAPAASLPSRSCVVIVQLARTPCETATCCSQSSVVPFGKARW